MSKKRFKITGEIQKENGEKFSKKEKENLLDDFIDFVEKKKLVFIGVTKYFLYNR